MPLLQLIRMLTFDRLKIFKTDEISTDKQTWSEAHLSPKFLCERDKIHIKYLRINYSQVPLSQRYS